MEINNETITKITKTKIARLQISIAFGIVDKQEHLSAFNRAYAHSYFVILNARTLNKEQMEFPLIIIVATDNICYISKCT